MWPRCAGVETLTIRAFDYAARKKLVLSTTLEAAVRAFNYTQSRG